MMSLTSVGRTASARLRASAAGTDAAAPLERSPVAGQPHDQAEPVQGPASRPASRPDGRPALRTRRGPQHRQPVDTEEIPGHEQRPGQFG